MIMADVFAVFGTLLAVGMALPGLLLTWRLLLPSIVGRAQQRLEQTPWRCFFVGSGFLFVYLVPTLVLSSLPWAGFKALGFIASFLLLTMASIGAAGLASLMGERLEQLGLGVSGSGATVRGAIALTLAVAFPLVGWFIFLPLMFMLVLGGAFFALLGWTPRRVASTTPAPSTVQNPMQP
jgi:hypothetical protein